jgi:hypothetical protein
MHGTAFHHLYDAHAKDVYGSYTIVGPRATPAT